MTERTPMGGDFRFLYGRIASPENQVRRGGALISELEAEYTADFNGQGWGQPVVLLCDQQGALLTRQIAISTAGGGGASVIFGWDVEQAQHVTQFNAENLAYPNASVLYGNNGTPFQNVTDKPEFDQLRTLGAGNIPSALALASGILATARLPQRTANILAAENVQAGLTIAAPPAGAVHIVQGFEFTLTGSGVTPLDLSIRLRDGVGGPILWESYFAKEGVTHMIAAAIDDISIAMTAATAIRLEFSAAGGANTFQSINCRYITVN